MSQKFFTGDVVRYVNSKGDAFWALKQKHIIHECSYQGEGLFEYSTNYGAWFTDDDFELVYRATRASFKELDKDIALEEEE